ncbi:polyhydroxyalkanoate synthase [Nocardia amikacinitolerans]|uniref:Polyhydroxyalkanoate synthase n=1 Tax=Nocardia amikacinitolerans TaxID=756689 RepID=A0A285LX98_9NOCA|nr:alpha/beta fold hydrolase [Nocardia amikacinitolerans]MCP2279600.1 polyhydroxyalkanoate synthase [Nocardia amikacinitolerans]MCP2298614.1 polyhydroxyalkanoate synthase [Nocardia amikacinitolerans]SNY89505.1 polyhydroxyalkanoate synthase [Nocardia amikacinitolerans]
MVVDNSAFSDEHAVPLDLLLTGSALGMGRRMLPNSSWSRLALDLAKRPRFVVDKLGGLGDELAAIVRGASTRAPAKADKRFADPAWQTNPLFRRAMQTWLAADDTVHALLAEADLDWRDAEWMRFVVDNILEALAPSNNPLFSPPAWKALVDTGGLSAIRGFRHFLDDFSDAPRVPSTVAPDAFTVGETVALTPGSVVARTEMFELIQYAPQTDQVRAVPLLIVPPMINKFYILDISPDRSMIEYLVRGGQQVFTISWRNPTAQQRDWGLDNYGQAVLDALDAVERISGSDRAHVQASCSGGILAAMTAAHLAATDQVERLAGLTLLVTVLDQHRAGLAAAALDEDTANVAIAMSARQGYLDGRSLAEVFAFLRPTDLVWRYWINNYLQGRRPEPFDVLFWNADTTRMPAALHRDMVMMGVHNTLAAPNQATMLGTQVDLSMLPVDAYVVAGIADHISPWQACYRSARLLGSKDLRFVLSTSGHIAALVNPPGNPRASFRVGSTDRIEPGEWAEAHAPQQGSWWPNYAAWLAERSGPEVDAPSALGSAEFPPLVEAPGTYVLER